MGKRIIFYLTIVLFSLLITGCATTSNPDMRKDNMRKGLDSCLMKLTKARLIMQASIPTEKVNVDNGEIWIYKYRKSDILTTTNATDGLLSPNESESKSYEYALDVRLHFNNKGILNEWSYKGNIDAFEHPFKTMRCE